MQLKNRGMHCHDIRECVHLQFSMLIHATSVRKTLLTHTQKPKLCTGARLQHSKNYELIAAMLRQGDPVTGHALSQAFRTACTITTTSSFTLPLIAKIQRLTESVVLVS
jgi:hypothetical protein